MKKIPNLFNFFLHLLNFINLAAGLLIFLSLLTTFHVFARNFLQFSIFDYIYFLENSILLIIILPLSAIYLRHIKITFLYDKFTEKTKLKINLIIEIIAIFLSIVLLLASWNSFYHIWNNNDYYEGDFNIPEWPSRLIFFLSILIFMLTLCYNFIKKFFLKIKNKPTLVFNVFYKK